MIEKCKEDNYTTIRERLLPKAIRESWEIERPEELLKEKEPCISFQTSNTAKFLKKGSYVLLDFGKEVCGSVRLITRAISSGTANFRITLGESITEACSTLGENNATNDHSPRDFEVMVPSMSDLVFGLSGFRFARIELLTETNVLMKNIFAVNIMRDFEKQASIITSDPELNKIIETAAYTLRLNFQNGYIWDGIKRDRLVWCGDLNPEIITSIYLYGDNVNITNSLSFLRNETPDDAWMNTIPSYSAWWIINLCDYCRMTGNQDYFDNNRSYAVALLHKMNACIYEDGTIDFHLPPYAMSFYLDWPTYNTPDAVVGLACLFICAAKAYLNYEEDEVCHAIIRKLQGYLQQDCTFKQTRAFQILAGRNPKGEIEFLEKNGAEGLSTFMAYYILTADAMAGGKDMLSIIKEYYGGMLQRGATTFWEDFNISWLEGSGRIDEFPKEGETDIHGDYGAFCYKGLRHSLCHGWASGVLAFIIEYMLGLHISGGERSTR